MMGVLRAGATGYVRKDAEPETLLAAVRAVARGRTFIDPSIGHRVLRTDTSDDLTPRELDVLRHVALGKSNKDIAVALDISEETVKTHVRHVLAKLGAENRAQAAVRDSHAVSCHRKTSPPTDSFSPSSSPGHFVCSLVCRSCHVCRTRLTHGLHRARASHCCRASAR